MIKPLTRLFGRLLCSLGLHSWAKAPGLKSLIALYCTREDCSVTEVMAFPGPPPARARESRYERTEETDEP